MLAWTIYLSFLGALAARLSPTKQIARVLALLTALAAFALSLMTLVHWQPGEILTVANVPWVPQLGLSYHLAADGISLTLLLLTGIAATAGILFSWNIEHRTQEFFAFYLVLIGGVYGVFLSFDLFLLFVFYEIAIIPKYFLIAIWGSVPRDASPENRGSLREYAAMKLALYSFAGSALVLAGMVAAWTVSGGHSLTFEALASYPFPVHFQLWAFPLVFVGFAVLAGMWPFHTWAPTGHAAAPTAASMLLAGVVMKLGAYGCLRVAMMLFPRGLDPWGFHVLGFGSWRDVFALLALIGIVYGAGVALVQRDFKFVIGYSSVSHMGFVLLGLMTLTQIGLGGAVFQMFSHGVIAGLLFAVVGRMVYDRTHTRDLNELGPMRLARVIPFAAVTFVLAAMASIGLPGFSGFIAEFQILLGAGRTLPWMAVVAGIGILLGIAFTWRALTKVFFGEPAPGAAAPHCDCPPITLPEKCGAVLLLATTLAVGLYPRVLTDLILPALNSPLFHGLRGGTWR
ncbi:MAG TPA: NADH-quinone oxidoreductase subunit M [Acidobacteriaceae bacterium]|jgi:NADH-quinone oxidoreductase subunit M|nr:NADH-quinone oxidoreductase subunit M [Acidobacteriaceae bacterium]